MFKTAEHFVARLTEVEKMSIRRANEDQMHWLFYNMHQHEFDLDSPESLLTFLSTKSIIDQNFADISAQPHFGKTWAF